MSGWSGQRLTLLREAEVGHLGGDGGAEVQVPQHLLQQLLSLYRGVGGVAWDPLAERLHKESNQWK